MKTMKFRITFTEELLGTLPNDPDVYEAYIASKAPDKTTLAEELETLSVGEMVEKSQTVFARAADGTPILWDYQIKGFFKDACGMLSRVKGETESSTLKAYKKVIDGLVFVRPRQIPIVFSGKVGNCQRPLRAQTAQGERTALANSETIPAGATAEFAVQLLDGTLEPVLLEWLDYGRDRGLGQWRNSGKGTFTYEVLE
jgi:hypothetical protein